MRRSREDTADTRRKIVTAASHLLRERGIEATSIADVMSAVGMTIGGFYRHFESKEALVQEAIAAASRETSARLRPRHPSDPFDLGRWVDGYLSDAHRRHPGRGCPVAALGSEVAHENQAVKKAFTDALEQLLASVDTAIRPTSKSERRKALFAVSAAVGALVLARATHDESLGAELLSAVRSGLGPKAARSRAGAS